MNAAGALWCSAGIRARRWRPQSIQSLFSSSARIPVNNVSVITLLAIARAFFSVSSCAGVNTAGYGPSFSSMVSACVVMSASVMVFGMRCLRRLEQLSKIEMRVAIVRSERNILRRVITTIKIKKKL